MLNLGGIVGLIVLSALPALATEEAKHQMSDDTVIWLAFTPFWVFLACLLVLGCFAIRAHFYRRSLVKELQRTYESLCSDKKDKLKLLEEQIVTTLDPYRPGLAKYTDAWKKWSEEDRKVMGRKWLGILKNGYSRYAVVESSMELAEAAMREVKQCQKTLEKAKVAADDKKRNAAMMWGMFWNEEVSKEKDKKARKEENMFEV